MEKELVRECDHTVCPLTSGKRDRCCPMVEKLLAEGKRVCFSTVQKGVREWIRKPGMQNGYSEQGEVIGRPAHCTLV